MKQGVINPDLLSHLKQLGHGDLIAVVDWANPAYTTAREGDKPLFDFGFAPNLISAQQALQALAETIAVEKVYYATEMAPVIGPDAADKLLAPLVGVDRSPVRHVELRNLIGNSHFIVRTGAPGNYLNFVLQVGAEKWE